MLDSRRQSRRAHVDALVVGIFKLLDTFVMVWNHPVCPGTILHAPEDELRDLPRRVSLYLVATRPRDVGVGLTLRPDLPRFTYSILWLD